MFLIISVSALSFCLTGCMDKREIESLAFAVALGVDADSYNNVIASVQIIKAGSKKKEEGTNEPSKAEVYVCSGNTIYDALNNLSQKLGMPIKFSNEKCLIIGEKFAELGVEPIIDLSLRFSDMRPITPILVTQGKASDILNLQTKENPISAFAIEALIKAQKRLGFAAVTTNLEFVNSIRSESGITTCGVINIDKKDKDVSDNSLILSGSAVFKKDKLIGFMNNRETRGMQWVKGKVRSGIIVIGTPKENKMSLNIIRSGSSIKPTIANKKIDIKVDIKEMSNIREIDQYKLENMDFNADPGIIDSLSRQQDEAIYKEVASAINAAQKRLNADIFDFGSSLYRDRPHEWNSLKNDWDEIFPYIDININISSEIKKTGAMSKSIE